MITKIVFLPAQPNAVTVRQTWIPLTLTENNQLAQLIIYFILSQLEHV